MCDRFVIWIIYRCIKYRGMARGLVREDGKTEGVDLLEVDGGLGRGPKLAPSGLTVGNTAKNLGSGWGRYDDACLSSEMEKNITMLRSVDA
jgi:hypothetical protein